MSASRVYPNRATVLPLLAGLAVLALGCAVFSGVRAHSLTAGDPAGNAALVDPIATSEMADQVGAGVKAIFSYDYSDLSRTERAAADVLVDSAATRYRDVFAPAEKLAEDQKLVRTTTIRSLGVRDLRGDRASVLLFLDQQTLHTVDNRQDSAGAQLFITAKRVGGRWKIADLTPL